jgi:ABC-type sulfate/molybdate transport systems ATPase subunit
VLALGAGTPVVILDEPASALDRQYQKALDYYLQALRSEKTLLFVSHHYQDVMRHADRMLQLEQGRLVADQPVDSRQPVMCLCFEAPESQAQQIAALVAGALQQKRYGKVWEIYTSDSDALLRQLVQSGIDFARLQLQPAAAEASA